MEDGEVVVGIFMYAHLRFDVVAAMPIGRELQQLFVIHDAVIGTHHAVFL